MSREASARGFAGAGVRLRGTNQPTSLRSFTDTPREDAELALRASWLSDHLALNLQGSVVADPEDGKQLRADGSYLGVNIGNFMISAGLMERWWGPGWDGSLILSTNARPIPSITLERNYTDPFKSKLALLDRSMARQHCPRRNGGRMTSPFPTCDSSRRE